MHSGSAHSGHYFCYVKDVTSSSSSTTSVSRWLLFNDSTVTSLSDEQLSVILGVAQGSPAAGGPPTAAPAQPTVPSANNAYMLVYREVSEINVSGVDVQDSSLPADLLAEVRADNESYAQQKAKYDYEKAFLNISVSPVLVGAGASRLTKDIAKSSTPLPCFVFRIHESATLAQLTDMVYEKFCSFSASAPSTAEDKATPSLPPSSLPLLDASATSRSSIRLRAMDQIKGVLMASNSLLTQDRKSVV